MGDFGLERQRVEFVGDVQENDDSETPRLDRAAHVFCVPMKILISQRERCFSPLDVEMIDWKFCVHVPPGLCDVSSDRHSPLPYEFGVCWVNLCNITASSVMFFSPTELVAP